MGSVCHGHTQVTGKDHQVKRKAILIGLGRIGWSLEQDRLRYHPCTHAGSVLAHSGCELVAVCDTDPDQVQRFLRWWPGKPRVFLDSKDLFNAIRKADSDELKKNRFADLAIVATPQDVHTSQCIELLRLGIEDVLIEKPPGETRADMNRLEKAMSSSHSRLWINFERRYHPGYRKVKQFLDSARFGQVRSVRGRVYSGASPLHPGSGPLLHDAVHWLDLMLWFFGDPMKMAGKLIRDKHGLERSSSLQFLYPGFVANLVTGARSRYFEFEMEIDFDQARIQCGNSGFKLWKAKRSKRYSGFQELQDQSFSVPEGNPWKEMYKTIVAAQRQPEKYHRQATIQGLDTGRLVHKAYKSL